MRTSYLFTDLTEANAGETIRYAKLGGFRYILVYSGTWSASLGSYPINTRNFPRGEESLKAVIDKCHAAGLKVGMHMLTSFVGKNDPRVWPKPSPWLLKDAEATLATDVSETVTELAAASALAGFPVEDGYYGTANDILIDDEIIHYGQINGSRFVQCVRGFVGTKPVPHKTGAKIYHLAEREGSYLADLKTSLKDAISDRVAGVINRCGFDMIYFDGGEINSANGPAWYWMGAQQVRWLQSALDSLSERAIITTRQGTATRPSVHLLNFLDTVRIGGVTATPPPTENTALPGQAPRLDIESEATEVLDRVLKASETRTDAELLTTARRWLHGYCCKLGTDPNCHPPDNRIVAQFLAIAEWPRLERLLYDLLAERRPPGYSYAWFISVALQRIHGIHATRLKARRAELKLVRAGHGAAAPPPEQTANPEWSAQLLTGLVACAK